MWIYGVGSAETASRSIMLIAPSSAKAEYATTGNAITWRCPASWLQTPERTVTLSNRQSKLAREGLPEM